MHCVLIVEDSEDDQFFFTRAVKKSRMDLHDVDFIFAEDGTSALAWIEENGCPELVITDNSMAPMNGVQFITSINQIENTPHVPIAMWTDHIDDPDLASIKHNLVSIFHKKHCEKLTPWIEKMIREYVLSVA